jgi:predicted enzyme related to lactoylglutathione lyase
MSIENKEFVMAQGFSALVYPVKDLAGAKRLFSRFLGVEPYVDAPYYVGYRVGDQEIGLDPNGHKSGIAGPIAYRDVDDIQRDLQLLLDAGAQVHQPVRDVGGGLLVATVKDADNNILGLRQAP